MTKVIVIDEQRDGSWKIINMADLPTHKEADERFGKEGSLDKWYRKGYNRCIDELTGEAKRQDAQMLAMEKAFGSDHD